MVKIDVEGSELDVIKGSVETLKRSNYPPILFESWNEEWYEKNKQELFQFISSLGYAIYPVMGYPHMYIASDNIFKKEKI